MVPLHPADQSASTKEYYMVLVLNKWDQTPKPIKLQMFKGAEMEHL